MTNEDFKYAGKIVDAVALSDEDLKLALKATEAVLAYCIGRGEFFKMVRSYVSQDAERLREYVEARKLKC